jgi:hypothetical protein
MTDAEEKLKRVRLALEKSRLAFEKDFPQNQKLQGKVSSTHVKTVKPDKVKVVKIKKETKTIQVTKGKKSISKSVSKGKRTGTIPVETKPFSSSKGETVPYRKVLNLSEIDKEKYKKLKEVREERNRTSHEKQSKISRDIKRKEVTQQNRTEREIRRKEESEKEALNKQNRIASKFRKEKRVEVKKQKKVEKQIKTLTKKAEVAGLAVKKFSAGKSLEELESDKNQRQLNNFREKAEKAYLSQLKKTNPKKYNNFLKLKKKAEMIKEKVQLEIAASNIALSKKDRGKKHELSKKLSQAETLEQYRRARTDEVEKQERKRREEFYAKKVESAKIKKQPIRQPDLILKERLDKKLPELSPEDRAAARLKKQIDLTDSEFTVYQEDSIPSKALQNVKGKTQKQASKQLQTKIKENVNPYEKVNVEGFAKQRDIGKIYAKKRVKRQEAFVSGEAVRKDIGYWGALISFREYVDGKPTGRTFERYSAVALDEKTLKNNVVARLTQVNTGQVQNSPGVHAEVTSNGVWMVESVTPHFIEYDNDKSWGKRRKDPLIMYQDSTIDEINTAGGVKAIMDEYVKSKEDETSYQEDKRKEEAVALAAEEKD